MSIKDTVRIEGLNMAPVSKSNIQKSKCSVCIEFANIYCINCNHNNIWLCVEASVQHRDEKYGG